MDGLTITNSQRLLDTGQTQSELSTKKVRPDSTLPNDGSDSFAKTLENAVNRVNELQKDADKKMQDLSTGKNTNVAEVMIASEKADIALRLMTQVRNKVIDAYHEIMKMQV